MPKQERSINVPGMDSDAILSVCLSSFKQLDWEVKFAGENSLLAFTPKTWRSKSQQIVVTAPENRLSISSKTTGDELIDVAGKNKKNIALFFETFENARKNLTPLEDQNNSAAIATLRAETERVAQEEQIHAEELDKALNLSGSNLYVTYGIIALNVIVFILMAIDGAGIMAPNGLVHLKWGSNYGPLTLSGDWWRLITNVFIHFGIIHIAMNMYTLYMAGVYLEPLLGKARYITAYLCTGVLASIASLWWHSTPANSAGASGAIFGMYGVFLAFLTTSLIPELVRKGLLQSIGIFVVYNLAYGMKGGVDNAAHVGGLLSGLIIGYLFVLDIKKERQQQKLVWVLPLTILLTTGITFSYLQQHKSSIEERSAILGELEDERFKDNTKFNTAYNKFIEVDKSALAVWNDSTITDEQRVVELKEKSLPEWDKAETLIREIQTYDVSKKMQRKAALALQYIELRKHEISVIDDIINKKVNGSRLGEVRTEINKTLEELNK